MTTIQHLIAVLHLAESRGDRAACTMLRTTIARLGCEARAMLRAAR